MLNSNWTLGMGWLLLGALSGCDSDQQLGTLDAAAGAAAGGGTRADTTTATVGVGGTTNPSGTSQGGATSGTGQGGATGTTTSTEPDPILCDGSTEIRLGITSAGGMVDVSYPLLHPYGYWFLFIDGSCRYWVGKDSGELRQGSLSASEALEVETALAFDHLGQFAGTDESCPDAGSTTLMDSAHQAECSCGCDTPEKAALFERIPTVRDDLFDKGLDQDWQLLAARTDFVYSGNALTWPLSWPVSDLPLLTYSTVRAPLGMTITDANDKQQLRALHATFEQISPGADIITLSSEPEQVGLVLSWQLPAETRERIDRFLAQPR